LVVFNVCVFVVLFWWRDKREAASCIGFTMCLGSGLGKKLDQIVVGTGPVFHLILRKNKEGKGGSKQSKKRIEKPVHDGAAKKGGEKNMGRAVFPNRAQCKIEKESGNVLGAHRGSLWDEL